MESLEIPTSIWINLGLIVAAAAFVWFKLSTAVAARPDKQRARQDRDAKRTVQTKPAQARL